MCDSTSQLEKYALVESLKGIVQELDDPSICKPCCAAGAPKQSQNNGTGGSTSKAPCKPRPKASSKQEPPSGKGDANSCRRTQPPPPPVGGTAVIIPVPTDHRRGRPMPIIVEPDYMRRQNPEKYIITLPEPTRVRSRELIASHMYHGCHCGKRDGLQDQCRRWECRGFPYCCANGLCKPSGGLGCDGTQCRKG